MIVDRTLQWHCNAQPCDANVKVDTYEQLHVVVCCIIVDDVGCVVVVAVVGFPYRCGTQSKRVQGIESRVRIRIENGRTYGLNDGFHE